MQVKAISLWQPWASLWAAGIKINETRSRPTSHRGLLAVHAALKRDRLGPIVYSDVPVMRTAGKLALSYSNLPFGAIVGVVEITHCFPTGAFDWDPLECKLGNFAPGRFAWRAENARLFKDPIPCKGLQGFFNVDIPESKLQ